MVRKLLFCLTLLFANVVTFAQNDPIVLKINGKPIYKSELEAAYLKGNQQKDADERMTLEQFADSYIDYKLNIEEAKVQQLDTTAGYKREYSSYKIILSNAYLKDRSIEDAIVNKIYGRLQQNYELNHVLLPFDKEAYLPSDTLALYKIAIKKRDELLKKGFKGEGLIDNTKTTSIVIDKDAQNGYLGWMIPFMLQPPVEDAIYALPVHEISMPIRSQKGYHIVQVINRRPSIGLIDIEQITFPFYHRPPSQHLIDSVGKVAQKTYNRVSVEKDFDKLCEAYIKSQESEATNCDFGVQALDVDLPPAFIHAAFDLKNAGDISKPVMTEFGYHIIRLKARIAEPPLSDIQGSLRNKIMNSDRVSYYTTAWRDRQFETYGLSVEQNAYDKINEIANSMSPTDPSFAKQITNRHEILFTIDGVRSYTVKDFAHYLSRYVKTTQAEDEINPMPMATKTIEGLSTDRLKNIFSNFATTSISHYADSTLEQKHPEFGRLMNEYAEGYLLFDVKNKNIWRKATEDKKGLDNFFTKNAAKYKWQTSRFKGILIFATSEEILKKAEKIAKTKMDWSQMQQAITNGLNSDSIVVKVETGLWQKGDNAFVDNKVYGANAPQSQSIYPYYSAKGKKINKPDNIDDVRSLVIKDYQDELEKEWTAYLHTKYEVEINKSALNNLE